MNTAERIKELREQKGLSQEQLAKIIGVDRTTIVKYETGASRPTRYLKRIAHFFDVTTDYLLGNDLQPKKGRYYYLDPETARIANEMKENPGRRVLFDATKNLSPEKIKQVQDFVNFITRDQDFSE